MNKSNTQNVSQLLAQRKVLLHELRSGKFQFSAETQATLVEVLRENEKIDGEITKLENQVQTHPDFRKERVLLSQLSECERNLANTPWIMFMRVHRLRKATAAIKTQIQEINNGALGENKRHLEELIIKRKNTQTFSEAEKWAQQFRTQEIISSLNELTLQILSLKGIYNPNEKCITFGRYEQGKGIEPISWFLLHFDWNEEKVFLLSKYGLDYLPYREVTDDDQQYGAPSRWIISWKKSTLRAWLNSTFLLSAFSQSEIPYILPTVIHDSDKVLKRKSERFLQDENIIVTVSEKTTDKIFLLSREEVNKYVAPLGLCYTSNTDYVRGKRFAANIDCNWWLRTPGGEVAQIQCEGNGKAWCFFDYPEDVRPAMYLDISNEALDLM